MAHHDNEQRARRRPRGTERRATTGSLLGGEGEQRRQRFLAFHPISCSTHINWAESLVRVAPNEYVAKHELCAQPDIFIRPLFGAQLSLHKPWGHTR